MTTKTDLQALGWRVDTSARLTQAIRDFQGMWNLGAALEVDGNAGPATQAALALSLSRNAKGLPDVSAHFSAHEFRCDCDQHGGPWADCRRIWAPRSTVQMAEKFRALVGPYSFDRACRCPAENKRVAGASQSQHLAGRGLDMPIYDISIDKVRAALGPVGIGTYAGNGRLYVRHIDNRGSWAQWPYGTLRTTPLKARPDLATAPITPSEEDDMSAEDTARLKDIETTLKALADAEAARYVTGTGRYSHLAGLSQGINAELVATKAAVGVLANSQGLNPELVQKTIADAVAEALSKITLTTQES